MASALLLTALGAAGAAGRVSAEYFTQNALCRENNCVKPIFPGLFELPALDSMVWQCGTHSQVSDFLDFCKEIVKYDPALKSPTSTQFVEQLVREQDGNASEVYFYHLSGLGYDAQEHFDPANSRDPCVQEVWRMACFTYFPKVQAGCQPGQPSPYLRPCRDTCERYVSACQVECCDESVQCAFQHQVFDAGVATSKVETGYVNVDGPSAVCTGSGKMGLLQSAGAKAAAPFRLLLAILGVHIVASVASGDDARPRCSGFAGRGILLAVAVVAASVCLQGCAMEIPHHEVGNWRRKPNYLASFEFIRPGEQPNTAILNSCSDGVPEALQCSGRGYCKEFNPRSTHDRVVSFCSCDRDWADPECRTRRKSQITTFLLATFGGVLGLDYFYLGFPLWGLAKAGTLGGCGLWWLIDIVRSGSGQVYASKYRVAADLPHWVFVLSTVTLFLVIGFLWSIESYLIFRKRKREDAMKLQEAEEARHLGKMDEVLDGPRHRAGFAPKRFQDRRSYGGYGATGAAPYSQMPPHASHHPQMYGNAAYHDVNL
mmetsp:Transcript_18896/g.54675  ORF Transcript_18896/g.54675 Transcript_18896/m.54675 type:complete len:543 (-) Transcript_18896:21-1649(-)